MASDNHRARYWITCGNEDLPKSHQPNALQIGDPSTYAEHWTRTGSCSAHSKDHKEIGRLGSVTVDGVEYALDDRWVISACPKCFEYRFGGSWNDADDQLTVIGDYWEEISEPFDRVEEPTLDERVVDLEARVAQLESALEEA